MGLCLAPAAAYPQAAPEDVPQIDWLCWITPAAEVSIRCVRDPDVPAPPDDQEDTDNVILLEQIHSDFYRGASSRELEEFFRSGYWIFKRGDYWIIPIYQEPDDSSWQEGRPERLVRAALCPRNATCIVRIRRP